MNMLLHKSTRKAILWAILALTVTAAACSGQSTLPLSTERTDVPEKAVVPNTSTPESPRLLEEGEVDARPETMQSPRQPQAALDQDVPTLPTFEVITVDLNAPLNKVILNRTLKKCPALDGMLASVFDAPNPIEMAETLQIQMRGYKIQVVLVVDGSDRAFLDNYEVEITKQFGDQIQAFVPIARLCEVAGDERILSMYPPSLAVPQE